MKTSSAEQSRFQLFLWVWFGILLLEKIGRIMPITDFGSRSNLSFGSSLLTFCLVWSLCCRTKWINIALVSSLELFVHHRPIPQELSILPCLVHWYLIDSASLILLIATAKALYTNGVKASIQEIGRYAAPGLRLLCITCLMCAGFSKLNRSFFTVEDSCASRMYEFAQQIYFFLPDLNIIKILSPYGVVFAELICPILLVYRRTRIPAVMISSFLLFTLGAIPPFTLYEFSGLFLAMLILFLPPTQLHAFFFENGGFIHNRLTANLCSNYQGLPHSIRVFFKLTIFSFIAWVIIVPNLTDQVTNIVVIQLAWWCIFALFFISLLLCLNVPTQAMEHFRTFIRGGTVLSYLLVLFAFINEALTYVGVTHFPVFSMASGLAVSRAYSNHLLVRNVPEWSGSRIARITRTTDPRLGVGGLYSWMPLKSHLLAFPQFTTEFQMDNQTIMTPLPAEERDLFLDTFGLPLNFHINVWPQHPLHCILKP